MVRAYAAEVRKLADQLRTAGSDASLQAQLERVSGQLARAAMSCAATRPRSKASAPSSAS
jgi:hypothetical protein